MSSLTGVKADAVRPALRAMASEIHEQFRQIDLTIKGYQSFIQLLTLQVTHWNRLIYTPEQHKAHCNQLDDYKIKLEQENDERSPRKKKIKEIYGRMLFVENLKTQSLHDIATITGCPAHAVEIMDQYLEEGSTWIDTYGQTHYK